MRNLPICLYLCCLLTTCLAAGERLPQASPADVGMDAAHLQRIDTAVEEGIAAGKMPGCVVCIGRQGKIVWLRAYGQRSVQPTRADMTTDTVFDMASITKPVATATSIMLLVERGQIRIRDSVATHLPEFADQGKEDVTIEDLLIHQGGLIPDNSLDDYHDGPEESLRRVLALPFHVEPKTKFVYSDMGFVVLGEVVRRVSRKDVHTFSHENIFAPLGMSETGYLPNDELRARAAVTEEREGRWMQGEVHDPRAYLLGGIAGHAGLFSTADDLAVYAQMMLDEGEYGGVRILSPRT
ncbi:MAG TPA: serine hydrolase, partial [Nitrospiraceae bacterium]|nr:serine hydrolase [Nitrospiraceae bacterium]